MKYYAEGDLQTYRDSAKLLSLLSGTANTVILLISGYFGGKERFIGMDTRIYKSIEEGLLITMSGGGVFIVIKMIEYFDKLSHGLRSAQILFYLLLVDYGFSFITCIDRNGDFALFIYKIDEAFIQKIIH